MNLYSALSLMISVVYVFLGVILLQRNKRETLNQIFMLLCIAMAIWSFAYAFVYPATNLSNKNFIWVWYRISSLGWCLFPSIVLHFALAITSSRTVMNLKRIYILIYVPALFFIFKSLTGTLITYDFIPNKNVLLEVIQTDTSWFKLYLAFCILYLLVSFYLILKWQRTSQLKCEKRQGTIIFYSGLISFSLGLFSNIFAPLLNLKIPAIAPITSIFWLAGIWYAIEKYGFMSLTPSRAANQILNLTDDFVFLCNPAGTILGGNQKIYEELNYSLHELKGIPLHHIIKEKEVFQNKLADISKEKITQISLELNAIDCHNRLIPLLVHLSVIRNKTGDMLGLAVVGKDMRQTLQLQKEITERNYAENELRQAHNKLEQKVSERTAELRNINQKLHLEISRHKQTEIALRESEAMFRKLTETAPAAIYLLQDDKLLYVNSFFTATTGYTQEECLNINPWEFIHPDYRQITREMSQHLLKSKSSPSRYEIKILTKNRIERWQDISIDTIDFHGKPALIGVAYDITERKNDQAQIHYLTIHDKQTGLYNRTFIESQLKAHNLPLPVSLILGDVNGLKLVNDTLGFEEGDNLLTRVAQIFTQSCRENDIAARWGGDEFAILLPGTGEEKATEIFHKLKYNLKKSLRFKIPVTIALGQSTTSDINYDIQEIIKEAEDRMYRNKLLESQSNRSAFIDSLEKTLWSRNNETKEHCSRLRNIVNRIGTAISLSDSELDNLILLATLHDIGKIAIPDNILDKPDKLSAEEWEIIKKHPEIGYKIALSSPELAPIAEAILTHHERWDGTGYPMGISGKAIPLLARILSIADAYDVMLNGRPYRKALSKEEAAEEIMRCAGSQFDPVLAQVFIQTILYDETEQVISF